MVEENKQQWFKGKDFAFQLKDLEVTEDFTIWKAWDKRNEPMQDASGNEMKFPIRQGQLTDVEGNIKEFADLKYLKNAEFIRLFPKFGRNTRFNRNVIIAGAEYKFGFTKTSNDKIKELLEVCAGTGIDPLATTYTQSYNAANPPMTKYSVKITTAKAGVKPATGVGTVPAKPENAFNAKEKEVIGAIKSKYQDIKIESVKFIEIMKSNGIAESRAKELFKTL